MVVVLSRKSPKSLENVTAAFTYKKFQAFFVFDTHTHHVKSCHV